MTITDLHDLGGQVFECNKVRTTTARGVERRSSRTSQECGTDRPAKKSPFLAGVFATATQYSQNSSSPDQHADLPVPPQPRTTRPTKAHGDALIRAFSTKKYPRLIVVKNASIVSVKVDDRGFVVHKWTKKIVDLKQVYLVVKDNRRIYQLALEFTQRPGEKKPFTDVLQFNPTTSRFHADDFETAERTAGEPRRRGRGLGFVAKRGGFAKRPTNGILRQHARGVATQPWTPAPASPSAGKGKGPPPAAPVRVWRRHRVRRGAVPAEGRRWRGAAFRAFRRQSVRARRRLRCRGGPVRTTALQPVRRGRTPPRALPARRVRPGVRLRVRELRQHDAVGCGERPPDANPVRLPVAPIAAGRRSLRAHGRACASNAASFAGLRPVRADGRARTSNAAADARGEPLRATSAPGAGARSVRGDARHGEPLRGAGRAGCAEPLRVRAVPAADAAAAALEPVRVKGRRLSACGE